MKPIFVKPVAFVKNEIDVSSDDCWGGVISEITLIDELPEESFDRIEDFSHLEIIFQFHLLEHSTTHFKAHPRENPEWPEVGIFSRRNKDRPNLIGATMVKLVRHEGRKIFVENLDAVNGTPVLDIKPVISEFLPGEAVRQPSWASELMKNYFSGSAV